MVLEKPVFWCCICDGLLACCLNTVCELTGSAGLRFCPWAAPGLCWSRRACSVSPCCAVHSAQPSPAHASYIGPAHEPWERTHTHAERIEWAHAERQKPAVLGFFTVPVDHAALDRTINFHPSQSCSAAFALVHYNRGHLSQESCV